VLKPGHGCGHRTPYQSDFFFLKTLYLEVAQGSQESILAKFIKFVRYGYDDTIPSIPGFLQTSGYVCGQNSGQRKRAIPSDGPSHGFIASINQ
jgi:hypothetical protein